MLSAPVRTMRTSIADGGLTDAAELVRANAVIAGGDRQTLGEAVNVQEGVGKQGHAAPRHVVGQGLTAVKAASQAAQRIAGQIGLDHHDHLCRDAVQDRDSLLVDQGQRFLDIEATRHDVDAAEHDERHKLQLQLGDMEQGLVVENAVVVPEAAFERHDHGAEQLGRMGSNHTLGQTGRTRGVHDEGGVIEAGARHRFPVRCRRQEFRERDFIRPRRVADIDQCLEAGQLVADRRDPVAQRFLENQQPCCAVIDDVRDFIGCQPVVDRHRDRADLEQRVQAGDHFRKVPGHEGDAVAAADAPGGEGVGGPVDLLVPLTIAPAPAFEYQGRLVRPLPCGLRERHSQVHGESELRAEPRKP